ncbi:MAG: Citrate synthase (si), partial [uncultured Solirubrobacteraceae bacterium]
EPDRCAGGRHGDRAGGAERAGSEGPAYAEVLQPVGAGARHRGRRGDPRERPPAGQGGGRGLRHAQLRPGVHEHRVVQERHHVHRWRQGDPALPRLSHRAAGGEVDLPRGRVPAAPRRAAEPGRVLPVGARHHVPHVRAREHRQVPDRVPARRAPDGDAHLGGGGAVVVLPAGEGHLRPRAALHLDHPAAGEDAHDRGDDLPPHEGAADRLPRQLAPLRRELPVDGGAHVGAALRGEPGVRQGTRRAAHPARRPRAELLDERGARGRLVARRPVLGGRGGRGGALRAAARRRQRGRAAHDRADRPPEERPRLHRGGEGGEGEPPHGLRAPRLQELRPARPHREAARRPGVRAGRDGQGPRDRAQARGGGAQRRLLREPQAVPERRLLHGADLPLHGVPHVLLHRAVRDGADGGVAGAVGGDAARQGAEDRPAAADLRRLARARVRDEADRVPAGHAEGLDPEV